MKYYAVKLAFVLSTYSLALQHQLPGKHIRVGFIEFWPSIFTQPNAGRNTTAGSLALLVEWVAKRGNFTYDFVPLDYSNRFNGLSNEFKTKRLDWAAAPWLLSHGRNYVAGILFPYQYEEHAIVIPFPQREANIQSAVLPYTGNVWACIFLAMTAIVLSLVWLAQARKCVDGSAYPYPFPTFRGSAMYVVGVATNQGASCSSKARSTRLVAGTWCLASLVLVNAYSSSLTTYMTVPKISPMFRTFEDLANRSKPQILTRPDSFVRLLFETSATYQPYLGNGMKHPNDYCGRTTEALVKCSNLVKNGEHVMVVVYTDYRNTGSCQVSLAEGRFAPGYSGTVLPLNSPHKLMNLVDVLTLEAISYGLVDEWKKRYGSTENPCVDYKRSSSTEARSFTLKDLTSAFIILGVCTACSCVVFLSEMLFSRLKDFKPREMQVN